MKLSAAVLALAILNAAAGDSDFGELPPGITTKDAQTAWEDFVKNAFPTWCIDGNETRIDGVDGKCADGSKSGRYDPFYLAKWHSGKDPSLGGYPTDVDTRYPFYYASGFFGQACAGGNAHCSFDFDGGANNCAKCGKVVTENDDGPNGPGHVPPHIGLAALTRAYHDGGFGAVSTWFDFAMNGCRVLPNVLLPMIRAYFPRDENGKAAYPPPFTSEGGPGLPDGMTYPYPLEFVNFVGETCKAEQGKFASAQCYEQHSNGNATDFPEYLQPGHGSPKYCSVGAKEADVNNDWCPYIFFGPNRGKYRHPHIAFAAVESWLASKVIDECGEEWDDNDGKDYPHTPDHSIAWPKMAVVEGFEDHPMQPALTEAGGFIWPGDEGTKRKACKGMFSIEKYLTPTTIGTPLVADSGTPLVADSDEDSSSTAVSLSGAAMLVSAIMMMV